MRTLPILLCSLLALPAAAAPQFATVASPSAYADVWRKTVTDPDMLTDQDRETQILPGEQVLVKKIQGEWARIEAIEQPEFTHHQRWEGYPGWVLLSSITLNPSVATSTSTLPRQDVIPAAQALVRTPYVWGGLSKEGIDCSGLVHLAYRRHGMIVPRDSHEQWMKARPITRKELKSGDLIFSAKAENPKQITHVTLYEGYSGGYLFHSRQWRFGRIGSDKIDDDLTFDMVIEAPQTGMVVRKISFKEKYGKALDDVESGDRVGDRVIYFGSFLH